MRSILRSTLSAIVLLCCSCPSSALDFTVELFATTKDRPSTIYYVNGVGSAYVYANALLKLEGRPLMYCQPANLTLVGLNYIQLIEAELKRPSTNRPYQPQTPIEVVLIHALRASFPCGK